jgi:hypothetical protein
MIAFTSGIRSVAAMPFDLEFEDDLGQRRLRRLEQRCRRARETLADARAAYGTLLELPNASETQRYQALRQVEIAQQRLADIQFDIELALALAATPPRPDTDYWRDVV